MITPAIATGRNHSPFLAAFLLVSFITPALADPLVTTPGLFSMVIMDTDDEAPPASEVIKTNSDLAALSGTSTNGASYRARSQTDYGINRVFNRVSNGEAPSNPNDPGNPFTTSISLWSDSFLFQGQENQIGIVTFQFDVTGFLQGEEYSELSYVALLSPDPITLEESEMYALLYDETVPQLPSGTSFLYEKEVDSNDVPGDQQIHWRKNVSQAFTYGQPFYLVSILGGHAYQDSTLDAFGSAHFRMNMPEGAQLITGSGTRYPAIPEPSVVLLLLLAFITMFARFRGAPKPNCGKPSSG